MAILARPGAGAGAGASLLVLDCEVLFISSEGALQISLGSMLTADASLQAGDLYDSICFKHVYICFQTGRTSCWRHR
jgi:hypothetical protein